MKQAGTLFVAFCVVGAWAVQTQETRKSFNFVTGQAVYIVAVGSASRDLSLTQPMLEIERKAKKQFEKEKKFRVVSTLVDADFVFFILCDESSDNINELALALRPEDYAQHYANLDGLRIAALWQARGSSAERMSVKEVLIAEIRQPSIAKDLVKRFHREVLK